MLFRLEETKMKSLTQYKIFKFELQLFIRFNLILITANLLLSLPLVSLGQSTSRNKKVEPLLVINDANSPSLSFDGSRIVVMPEIGLSEVYNVNSKKKLGTYKLKYSSAEAISADGNQIIVFHSEIIGYDSDGHSISKDLYSIYEVNSGKLIRRDETETFQGGKQIMNLFIGNGGNYSKNISSDLNLLGNYIYPENYDNPNSNNPAIILGSLKTHTLIREFRTEDGFASGDWWYQVSLTPDGKYIAAHRNNIKNNRRNKTVVWDAKTGKIIFSLPISASWFSLADTGERIATRRNDDLGKIEFWKVKTGKLISALTEKAEGRKVKINRGVISPDGNLLVTTRDEDFYFWDTTTGRYITSQKQDDYSNSNATFITFSGDGKRIAIGSGGEVVTVWSVDEILKNPKDSKLPLIIAVN